MGRIGRSYPRFPQTEAREERRRGDRRLHLTGAIVGLLAALGLIGWLISR